MSRRSRKPSAGRAFRALCGPVRPGSGSLGFRPRKDVVPWTKGPMGYMERFAEGVWYVLDRESGLKGSGMTKPEAVSQLRGLLRARQEEVAAHPWEPRWWERR